MYHYLVCESERIYAARDELERSLDSSEWSKMRTVVHVEYNVEYKL